MINLVVSTTTKSLQLANWASYPQAERTSDTRLSHFLSTTEPKKIFIEWIWLGKILANSVQFTKFAKVFPRQNFALYGIFHIYIYIHMYIRSYHYNRDDRIKKHDSSYNRDICMFY